MFSSFISLKKLISILGIKDSYIFYLILIFLISSTIDLLSLSLIAPLITAFINPEDLYNYKYFDYFKKYKIESAVYFLGFFILFVFLFKTIISIFIRWLIRRFALKINRKMYFLLMQSYQNMQYEEFISRNTSEYIRNIRELPENSSSSIEMGLKVISEAIILMVIIIFLATISIKSLILLFTTIFLVFLFYQVFLKPINLRYGEKRIKASEHLYKYIVSCIKGFKEVKVISKEKFFLDQMDFFNKKIYKAQLNSSLITDSPRYIFEFFILLCAVIIILSITLSSEDFSLYLPSIGIFLFGGLRVLPGISALVTSLNIVYNNRYAVDIAYRDLKKYLSSKNKKNDYKNSKFNEFKSIKFSGCFFKYKNNSKDVFNNINFSLSRNECIGIVGESGSGKTTMIDLLLGLLKPYKGEIYFNDKITDDFTNKLDGNVAYIPQEPVILDESLKTNISLENEEKKIDYKKIEKSINQASLKSLIKTLPNNINTLIGEKGIRLSGGQNRRLALARTFYHGKQIIIMDEATSSLDQNTENFILEQLKEMKGKITIIVISHQSNTLKYCDKIYKVENKKIELQ